MFLDQVRVERRSAMAVEARAPVELTLVPEARDGRSNVVRCGTQADLAGGKREGWAISSLIDDKRAPRGMLRRNRLCGD